MAVVKSDSFTWQADDPLHVHDAWTSEPDGHDVPASRLMKQVGQAIDQIDTVVLVGREHAAALDLNGQQHELGRDHNAYD